MTEARKNTNQEPQTEDSLMSKDGLPDIKPQTAIATLDRSRYSDCEDDFEIETVSVAVGMAPTFIRKAIGKKTRLNAKDILRLLDQDCFSETLVPRSKVLDYLAALQAEDNQTKEMREEPRFGLFAGHVKDVLGSIPKRSVRCVVTSTPYWGLRIYKDPFFATWADGERCPFGHEQTPEGFLRHTTEVLSALYDILTDDGSIWWNVMDSFNTRTQIRSSAVEALRAMQGKDGRSWGDHECRRYSAGHSYLKDGEQCLVPAQIAERASRIGYYVKSVITWAKTGSLPEPQNSRVSRNLEYVLHLTKVRTPRFNKESYRTLPANLGGRNNGWETDKLSDVWTLPTSSGRDGHGAQFPIALPARCIALSTQEGDVVLDPFVGAGNSGIAAKVLKRQFIGIDVCDEYLATAKRRIAEAEDPGIAASSEATSTSPQPSPRSLP